MKPCWKDHGLTESGAKLADEFIDSLVEILGRMDPSIWGAVRREAEFRVWELPKRSADYQSAYERMNGENRKEGST
jgi:hypothetical protein